MSQIEKYGMRWPEGSTDLDIELYCYRHDERAEGEGGRLTRWQHFQNAADMLFNWEGSPRKVVWNEWTNRMLKAMIYEKFVGLAGAGSSGKSDAAAVFALVDWLSAPADTMFLVCSSTLQGARGRIWKSISELWGSLKAKWNNEGVAHPGKLVPSKGRVLGLDGNGDFTESAGLWLIAAGKDDEMEADEKLKGLKAPTGGVLRLIADEFSDLGMCVFVAMVGNMASTPGFKGIGMANPGSKLTPFARFVEPVDGWNSLSLGMEQWRTKYGVCLTFDAYRSPRMLTPALEVRQDDGSFRHSLYNWMSSNAHIESMKETFGEDSVEFWAQIRGMFCPTGMERTVWSETELLAAMKPVGPDEWDSPPTAMVVALDPAFVTDGDRSPLMWAECGTIKGMKVMNYVSKRIIAESGGKSLNDNGEEVEITVTENVINACREHCEMHGVPPYNFGFDCTGGGKVFAQWLGTKWSHVCREIDFGGAPVERRPDSKNEHTIYKNRVTQLWVQPKALVRKGQIRGVPMDVVEELCARRWHSKRHTGSKTGGSCVEEKKDMKKRLGKSPDLADTFTILVEVAILNGLLDVVEIKQDDNRRMQMFKTSMGQMSGGSKSFVAMPFVKRLTVSRRQGRQ